MSPPTSLVLIIFYPPLIVSFHLAAINAPCRSCFHRCHCPPSLVLDVVRTHRRRRRRRVVIGGATPASSATAFLHYDDFIEFDLINIDNSDEPTTNENNDNTWASSNSSPPSSSSPSLPLPSLFPRLQAILGSSPISYSASITHNLLQQLSAAGFVNDNDITQFARGFIDREEELSRISIHDFRWIPLDAHRARVGIIALLVREEEELLLLRRGANNNEMIRQDPAMTEAHPTVVNSGDRLTEMEVIQCMIELPMMIYLRGGKTITTWRRNDERESFREHAIYVAILATRHWNVTKIQLLIGIMNNKQRRRLSPFLREYPLPVDYLYETMVQRHGFPLPLPRESIDKYVK